MMINDGPSTDSSFSLCFIRWSAALPPVPVGLSHLLISPLGHIILFHVDLHKIVQHLITSDV